MSELMRDDGGHHLFFQIRGLFAHKQAGLSERDESPVLHGSCQEVWDGYQVCQKRKEGCCDIACAPGVRNAKEPLCTHLVF